MYEPLLDKQYQRQLHQYKKTDCEIQMGHVTTRRRKSDRWFRKRKKLVFLFAILCVFFLIYQILAFVRLSLDTSESARSEYLEKTNHMSDEEIEFLKKHITIYMPGVPSKDAHVYIKRGPTFTCLESKEVIYFTQINDNFCDCKDGTDEPSTSACPNNMFYCVTETFDRKRKIPSSRVNDGICDCCEGSDEWLNVTMPIPYNLQQSQWLNKSSQVFTTPCSNRCSRK